MLDRVASVADVEEKKRLWKLHTDIHIYGDIHSFTQTHIRTYIYKYIHTYLFIWQLIFLTLHFVNKSRENILGYRRIFLSLYFLFSYMYFYLWLKIIGFRYYFCQSFRPFWSSSGSKLYSTITGGVLFPPFILTDL